MNKPAADDVTAIREHMEYERGFEAAVSGRQRSLPGGCTDSSAWYRGWDEGYRLKPKTEPIF